MTERRIGIIINGATGRMGTTQHVANLLAIAADGGLVLGNGDRLIPDLLLVGRDADRLKGTVAVRHRSGSRTYVVSAVGSSAHVVPSCMQSQAALARVVTPVAASA